MVTKKSHQLLQRRHHRVRATVTGTAEKPRLTVFRSLKQISAQIIDDASGKTLAAASERELSKSKANKTERARAVGELLAGKAKNIKITAVVFDRGGYQYHGRVQALAEGARAGGLKF